MQSYKKILSLTKFVLGIFLVDDIETALPTYDLAVGGALLHRCSYFHCEFWVIGLLVVRVLVEVYL